MLGERGSANRRRPPIWRRFLANRSTIYYRSIGQGPNTQSQSGCAARHRPPRLGLLERYAVAQRPKQCLSGAPSGRILLSTGWSAVCSAGSGGATASPRATSRRQTAAFSVSGVPARALPDSFGSPCQACLCTKRKVAGLGVSTSSTNVNTAHREAARWRGRARGCVRRPAPARGAAQCQGRLRCVVYGVSDARSCAGSGRTIAARPC